jgi:hypothetical protein
MPWPEPLQNILNTEAERLRKEIVELSGEDADVIG